MDKIKDFFHDFSDVFFAIAVASVMFVVLSFNLGSWFSNSSNTVLADEPVPVSENRDKNSIPESENDSNKINTEENEKTEQSDGTEDQTKPEEINDTQNNNIESNETEVKTDNNIITEQKIISIPNGTPGSGIAKILKDNGLINDTKDFIQAAESLNLAHRLKSGSFEIPTNATIEDMVKIISGQKK